MSAIDREQMYRTNSTVYRYDTGRGRGRGQNLLMSNRTKKRGKKKLGGGGLGYKGFTSFQSSSSGASSTNTGVTANQLKNKFKSSFVKSAKTMGKKLD